MSDRTLKRTALDYGDKADVRSHESWARFLDAPERLQGRLVLLTTAGETPLHQFAFQPGDTLLMGSESAGAPPEAHAVAAARLRIPIRPDTRSLNLVVAAAMALGEALRQTDGYKLAP